MRTAVLCVFLASLAAFVTAGESKDGRAGLFSRSEESPLVVSAKLWFSEGHTLYGGMGGSARFDNDSNLMGSADVRFYLPKIPWVGLQGRFGITLSDSDGELDGELDCDADFTLMELNVTVTLAGRSSPIIVNHELPRSKLEAFAGMRSFQEEFECDAGGGNDFDYEAQWIGVQLGLRGEWALGDTYDGSEAARGWCLSGELAVLPWITVDGEGKLNGNKVFEHDSDSAYGVAASLGIGYRFQSLVFGAGYEWQHFKADDGDDLSHLESSRRGFYLQVALHF